MNARIEKITPGSWVAHSAGVWTADGSMMVADLGSREVTKSRKRAGRTDVRADARLIAAAPALLEALKEANQHLAVVGFPRDSRGKYDKHGEWGFGEAMPNEADAAEVKNAFVAIRAAIAKAVTP